MTQAGPERDFVGYGGRWPDPQWPGGARLALNFALNIEEGAEYSPLDGDAVTDTALGEGVGMDTGIVGRDLAAESMYEYGSRVGVWRLLRLFERYKLPLTLFACAQALERNAPLAASLRATDHDICCHGWRWEKPWKLDEAEEAQNIARALDSLERTLGRRPEGWCCRYGPSLATRRLLAASGVLYDSDAYNDELPYWTRVEGRAHLVVPYSLVTNDCKITPSGLQIADDMFALLRDAFDRLYDSDAYNDELPYWTRVEGRAHLVVPYSLVTNDCKITPSGLQIADDMFALLRDAFDRLYEEGESEPRMMSVGLHPRVIGHPGRVMGLVRFLDHVASKQRVWVCRRADIARHWKKTHPAPF